MFVCGHEIAQTFRRCLISHHLRKYLFYTVLAKISVLPDYITNVREQYKKYKYLLQLPFITSYIYKRRTNDVKFYGRIMSIVSYIFIGLTNHILLV